MNVVIVVLVVVVIPLMTFRLWQDVNRPKYFDDFADVMNWWLAVTDPSPWRLQELADTEVGTADTGPMFGRTYAVFYNQIEVGKLEIYPKSFYGKEDRTISTKLKLDWVRLLSYYQLVEFFHCSEADLWTAGG